MMKVILLAIAFNLSACGENSGHNTNGSVADAQENLLADDHNDEHSINIPEWLNTKVLPLTEKADLKPLIEMAANRKLILLGEASHGTHEYYIWRDKISRKLIENHDISFIAVEGDWASLYELNKYAKNLPGSADNVRDIMLGFDRWPEWMWANEEVMALIEWLREYNLDRPLDERVAFYGMDVYGQFKALEQVLEFFNRRMTHLADSAESLYACFARYSHDQWDYARAYARGQDNCSYKTELVMKILKEKEELAEEFPVEWFEAYQASMVVANAEAYLRSAVEGGTPGWNSRVMHMKKSVDYFLERKGGSGIVWAHNTHVGDARATRMALENRYNIGQLSREDYGKEQVLSLGFSTYKGKVHAGREWGDQRRKMEVPPGIEGSLEHYFYQTGKESFLWLIDDEDRNFEPLQEEIGHRAIGVTYNPAVEHMGNYVPTRVTERYDAMIFFKETTFLNPVE